MERTAIERTEEKVTLELNVVSESQKQLLFEGVAFVYRASANIKNQVRASLTGCRTCAQGFHQSSLEKNRSQ